MSKWLESLLPEFLIGALDFELRKVEESPIQFSTQKLGMHASNLKDYD